MYQICVPIKNQTFERCGKEKLVSDLKRINAHRVFLTLATYETDPAARKAVMDTFRENAAFLKQEGFEVGAWLWALHTTQPAFPQMQSLDGKDIRGVCCPADREFVQFSADYVAEIARNGAQIILFDDDLRYGFQEGNAPGCLCPQHLAQIESILGEKVSLEQMRQHLLNGGQNKYRDAFLQANGDALNNFARQVRQAVDRVDPQVRIGICACMSSWDLDGTDAYELATLFAGNTRPLVRLIGAPYWAVKRSWGCWLQDVIQLHRLESAWTNKGDVELLAEGDTFPRPRTNCPAAYLEGFDTAIRASGCAHGILKYVFDYYADATYEQGYLRAHLKNQPLYAGISDFFDSKTACGIRVWESQHKISQMKMPTPVNDTVRLEYLFFSYASRMLSHLAIPTIFEGEGVGNIVFDENARTLPLSALNSGMIMDIAAAQILTERGVDVGLAAIGQATCGQQEHFLANHNHIFSPNTQVCDIALKEGAQILSDMQTALGTVPVSYRYENEKGQRFLVLNVKTREKEPSVLYHYARGKQIAENLPYLSKKPLPAFACGHPHMYLLCKEDAQGKKAVGLWNFFADEAENVQITLDKAYKNCRFLGASGVLSGNTVTLDTIPPFGFAAIEVTS